MGGNDPLVAAVEAAGVRTWSTEEIAHELVELCTEQVRAQAAVKPVEADLTGGLGDNVDLVALRETLPRLQLARPASRLRPALPSPLCPARPPRFSPPRLTGARLKLTWKTWWLWFLPVKYPLGVAVVPAVKLS